MSTQEQVNSNDLFLQSCFTKQQALRRLRLLKDFLDFLFFDKQKTKVGEEAGFVLAINEFREKLKVRDLNYFEVDAQFLSNLGMSFYFAFTPENYNQKMKDLESSFSKSNKVVVYLPIEPSEQETVKMGVWFKTNVSKDILMDLQYDPSLIGGPAFSYRGVYKDYSIRSRIKAQKQAILKSLLAYAK